MGYSQYFSVVAILGCEFCERLAFYGIGSSLTLFLRSKLGYSTESATVSYTLWSSFSTLFSLLGGYLSDVYWGKKYTILTGAVIYFFSLLSISILTYVFEITSDIDVTSVSVIFWISLYIMSLGAGGIKANVGIFGADQLHAISANSQNNDNNINSDSDNLEQNIQQNNIYTALVQSYWNWFYFAINAGALISYSLIAYLCQDVSFALGWSIPTVAIAFALCFFLARANRYHEPDTHSNLLSDFIGVSWLALKSGCPPSFDAAIESYDAELVEEIRSLYGVLGFLAPMTLYWTVYSAMNSLFYSQGCQMNIDLDSFQFPIAALNDADIVIILLLVPLMDRVVYPMLKGRLTMLRKVGAGFAVLALAMIVAGLVEIWRKSTRTLSETSTCDSSVFVSELSVLWQIPQYTLVGVSEVFASITSLEFFSGQAPESMRAIVYSLNLMVTGLGYLISCLLVIMVDSWTPEWIPSDLDDGFLEYYYFLIAGIMLLTLAAFVPCAQRYEYKPGTDVAVELDVAEYQPVETVEEEDDL